MYSRTLSKMCVASVALLLVALSAPSICFSAEKKMLTWGTTSSTSGLFSLFVMMSKIINDQVPEINVSVRSTGASVHNVKLFEKNEIDIGAIDTRTAWQASQGKGPFEGKAVPNLRLLHVITWNNAIQFVVSETSGIKNIYDLNGRTFTAGMLGSSTEMNATDIFNALGIHPKLRHSSYADAVEAMKNQMIVGFGKSVAPDSSILEVMSAMKIRILSLSDTEIEQIQKGVSGLSKIVLPSGIYPGIGEVKTVESQYCDFVTKDLPSEIGYKILKALWEKRKDIKNVNGAFIGDELTGAVNIKAPVYLHSGAVKFYKEIGLNVPKSLIPPETGDR